MWVFQTIHWALTRLIDRHLLTLLLTSSCSAFRPAIEKCPMSARIIAKLSYALGTQQKPYDSKALWRFQRSHTGKNFLFGSLFVLTGSLDVTVIPVFCLVLKKKSPCLERIARISTLAPHFLLSMRPSQCCLKPARSFPLPVCTHYEVAGEKGPHSAGQRNPGVPFTW